MKPTIEQVRKVLWACQGLAHGDIEREEIRAMYASLEGMVLVKARTCSCGHCLDCLRVERQAEQLIGETDALRAYKAKP